jgi:hypothetical protein
VIVVLAFVYAVLALTSGSGIPRNASVLGVDIGGQTPEQAAATLDKALGSAAREPIEATVQGKHISISPAQAGLGFDAKATVAPYQAGPGIRSPWLASSPAEYRSLPL